MDEEERRVQERDSTLALGKLRAIGKVVTEVQKVEAVTGADLRRERARTSAQVKACRDCGLAPSPDTGDLPVPFSGALRGACEQVNTQSQSQTASNESLTASREQVFDADRPGFSVVGEAPGREEVTKGEPFIGRAGKLLRAMVTEAGFDWPTQVARMNVVSCWPKADGRTRGPSDKEMSACRKHLDHQLEVASWSHVLLVGGYALKAFRSDLKISHVHGGVYVWRNLYVVMPIYHPAAILRDKTLKKPTQLDLSLWYQVVSGEKSWLTGLKRNCVKCDQSAIRYDVDCVPYCDRHYEMWGDKTWRVERKRWDARVQTTSLF